MSDGLRPLIDHEEGFVIQGGVGGIRFQWEELDEAARLLRLLASQVGAVALDLAFLDRDLGALPWLVMRAGPAAAVAGRQYQSALGQVHAAATSAQENNRALESTGVRLGTSVQAYRLADGVVRAATEGVRAGSALMAREAAREALDRGALSAGPIDLRRRATAPEVPFTGTVEGVLDRVAAVENDDPGTFEVLRTGPDGHPNFVVVLPGTQSGRVDGREGANPFDVGGIAEALAEDSRFLEEAVGTALERAGAEAGDPVLLAGYSQGGLHAVNLAGSDALGDRFDVQLVVTIGSPTGWHETGSGEYLHLEHRDDAVPGLDTVPNEDDRHRTTVRLGNPVPELGRRPDGSTEPWGLGPAHKVENYLQGARLVDASDAPSLAPAVALLAAAGASGTARRYSFTALRRREGGAAPERRGPRGEAGRGSRLWP